MIIGIDGRPTERSASRNRGIGMYTRRLCEALFARNRALGYPYRFVVASSGPVEWKGGRAGERKGGGVEEWESGRVGEEVGGRGHESESVTVARIPAIRRPSRLQWLLDAWALPRFLKRYSVEIFHATDFTSIPGTSRAKVVANVHDMIPFVFWKEYSARIPADFRWALQRARQRMHRADRIITDSQHSKQDIVEITGYPENRIHVVYFGPSFGMRNSEFRMRNERQLESQVASRTSQVEGQQIENDASQDEGQQVSKSAGQQFDIPHSAIRNPHSNNPQSEIRNPQLEDPQSDDPPLPPYFGHQTGESYPYFLYVGGTDFRKNVPFLIRGFSAFSRKRTDAKLLLVGETFLMRDLEEVKEIYSEIDRRGLHNRVQATGFVNERLLQLIYRRAVALIFPSLYEGFGVPVLEAMTAGTPVLAAARSSIPEILGDTGLYFDPRDQDSLVEVMERIYDSPALRKQLTARARERARQFSWKEASERIFQIYEELK